MKSSYRKFYNLGFRLHEKVYTEGLQYGRLSSNVDTGALTEKSIIIMMLLMGASFGEGGKVTLDTGMGK